MGLQAKWQVTRLWRHLSAGRGKGTWYEYLFVFCVQVLARIFSPFSRVLAQIVFAAVESVQAGLFNPLTFEFGRNQTLSVITVEPFEAQGPKNRSISISVEVKPC